MGNLFDRDFDLEIEREHKARQRLARARYTEEDLSSAVEQATRDGFEQGRDAGRREALEEFRQNKLNHQAETLAVVSHQIGQLFSEADARVELLEQQLLSYILAVFEKVAPELILRRAAPRAEAEVRAALSLALGKSGLRVSLPADMYDAIGAALEKVAEAGDFKGRTEVTADAGLAEGDALVEWDNGFMQYSFNTICNRILDGLRAASQPHGAEPTPPIRSETHD